MREISVGEANVGDVVAEPVTNEQGRVLLPKGSRLSAAVLSRLGGWGVTHLRIEGEDQTDAPGDEPVDLLAQLDHRFAPWQGDELMMAIKDTAARHLQRR